MKMELRIAERAAQEQRYKLVAFAAALCVAIAAAAISPVGYRGAGWDDGQYLAAARCWVEHGWPCVPHVHWWTRWPIVAPVAGFTALLGESRFSAELAPALWWALALAMTASLGTAWFGWRAGAISLALLGSSPVIALEAFDLNVDIPELALQLAALFVSTVAYRRQSRGIALAAGLLAGLSVQARDTSLLFVAASAAGWLLLDKEKRKILLWAVPGLISVELLELLIYGLGTGDPLLRLRLAMDNAKVPTDQLPAGFHSTRGPLLNPDYMRGWKREQGILVWWPIDPWLNLIASPRSSMLLICGTAAVIVLGRDLRASEKLLVKRLLCAGILIALGLVYVLTIDPKPRAFMNLYAAIALAAGASVAACARGPKRSLGTTLVAIACAWGIFVMSQYSTSARSEARARQWVARYGQDIEMFPAAASFLALVPETHGLPPQGSGRRYVIANSNLPCATMVVRRGGKPNGRVVDEISEQGQLCLLEYLPERPSVTTRSRRL